MEDISKIGSAKSSVQCYVFNDVDIKRNFVSFKVVCSFHPKYLCGFKGKKDRLVLVTSCMATFKV